MNDAQGLGIIWFSLNIDRIKRMTERVNYSLSDDLYSYCLDIVEPIFDSYDETRNVPLDRYMMSILRKRCIAECGRMRKRQMCDVPLRECDVLTNHNHLALDVHDSLLSILKGLDPPLTCEETNVFRMYQIEDRTFEEIAELTNSSASSVRRVYWQTFWRIRALANGCKFE